MVPTIWRCFLSEDWRLNVYRNFLTVRQRVHQCITICHPHKPDTSPLYTLPYVKFSGQTLAGRSFQGLCKYVCSEHAYELAYGCASIFIAGSIVVDHDLSASSFQHLSSILDGSIVVGCVKHIPQQLLSGSVLEHTSRAREPHQATGAIYTCNVILLRLGR